MPLSFLSAVALKLMVPIFHNARVYLLADKKDKVDQFSELKIDLGNAGLPIVGARFKEDTGRPDHREVRYFNIIDKEQAEKIAEVMRLKFSTKARIANEHKDPTAKPGYLEIWLRRYPAHQPNRPRASSAGGR